MDLSDSPNLAMLKYYNSTDCSNSVGLSDDGTSFGKDAASRSAVASIDVPKDVACSNGQVVPIYLVAYRKTQFFMPIRGKPAPQKLKQVLGLKLCKLCNFSRFTAFLWEDENAKELNLNEKDEYHEVTDDRCRAGLYSEHHPVLSATIIGNQENRNNKVKARLRFSAKKASIYKCFTVFLKIL